jgi:hypothetical protein
MDIASIIATAQDPQVRSDMLANLDEAQLASLPANLRVEA